jgi:glycosyltransferase involved in cell wall biosynthesis
MVDEVILVDDGSSDETAALARRIGLRTIVHEKNLGYGGNQKTCYAEALRRGADIVVMVHPDYQYTPKLIPALARTKMSRERAIAPNDLVADAIEAPTVVRDGIDVGCWNALPPGSFRSPELSTVARCKERVSAADNSPDAIGTRRRQATAVRYA